MARTPTLALLLVGVMAAAAAAQAPCVGASEADNEFYRITPADMDVIRAKHVLFGSRSFGLCLKSGLGRLASQNPIYAIDISPSHNVNSNGPEALPLDAMTKHTFVHYLCTLHSGLARVSELDRFVRERYHDQMDIGMLDYHLADPNQTDRKIPGTNLFDYYMRTLGKLRADFPDTRYIFVTSGLMPMPDYPGNVKSWEFGERVLRKYRGVVPILDWRNLLSTHADGRPAGKMMCLEFNSVNFDKTHPNSTFSVERLGRAYLVLLWKMYRNPGLIANAGFDRTVFDARGDGAEMVTLDGSASSHLVPPGPGGKVGRGRRIVRYVWRESGKVLARGAAPTAKVRLGLGMHTITLAVTNDASPPEASSDQVCITVARPKPVVAHAGKDQQVIDLPSNPHTGYEGVALDATASTCADGRTIPGYAWTEAGQPIATGKFPRLNLCDGIHKITLTVTDDADPPNTDSDSIVVTVTEPNVRVSEGLQALYTFQEGSGDVVKDVSAVGDSPNLIIAEPKAVRWLEGGGLAVTSAVVIASPGPAAKVHDACVAASAVSLEAWVKPADAAQNGPACILTLSADHDNRNVTLAQGVAAPKSSACYNARLRASGVSNNGEPGLVTADTTATAELTHVVTTRDATGQARIYVNGVERAVGEVEGLLQVWDKAYRLALADELVGGRPWLGTYYLVAVYDRALSPGEVNRNLQAGIRPVNPTPPRTVGWQAVVHHGKAGDDLPALTKEYVEPREGGLGTVRVTLGGAVVASTVTADAVKVTGAKAGDLSDRVKDVSLDATGRRVTIQLAALPDADRIKIELLKTIRDPWNQPLQWTGLPVAVRPHVTVGILVGDVDASGVVTDDDVAAVRSRIGRASTGPDARYDVDCSGDITEADAKMVQTRSGRALP